MSLSNVAASVRQRLLSRARETGEDYQTLLTRYALERLLFRLGHSSKGKRFVLKGAYAFLIWQGESHRQTRDLDLLGYGAPESSRLEDLFRHLCAADVPDDGVLFETSSVAAAPIREQTEYGGIRLTLTARIDTARLPLQVDVGFGDAVTPAPLVEIFPALLEFPAPQVRAYPRETVIAEKLHAIVQFGIASSRMRDYYDLWYLSRRFAFEGPALTDAIAATFERRSTPLPSALPQGLTAAFGEDARKKQQWRAFRKNSYLAAEAPSLASAVEALGAFLGPPLEVLGAGHSLDARWPAGGLWKAR